MEHRMDLAKDSDRRKVAIYCLSLIQEGITKKTTMVQRALKEFNFVKPYRQLLERIAAEQSYMLEQLD